MQTDKPAEVLHFGRHIERLREQQALTEEQLAARAGVGVNTILAIERGDLSPSLDTMRRISRGLDISIAELFESFEQQEDR